MGTGVPDKVTALCTQLHSSSVDHQSYSITHSFTQISLYGLYRPRCSLSPERSLNQITHLTQIISAQLNPTQVQLNSTPLHSTPLHSTPLHTTPHHSAQFNSHWKPWVVMMMAALLSVVAPEVVILRLSFWQLPVPPVTTTLIFNACVHISNKPDDFNNSLLGIGKMIYI